MVCVLCSGLCFNTFYYTFCLFVSYFSPFCLASGGCESYAQFLETLTGLLSQNGNSNYIQPTYTWSVSCLRHQVGGWDRGVILVDFLVGEGVQLLDERFPLAILAGICLARLGRALSLP